MTATATSSDPAAKLVADPQDPLPESNWIPRRWFAFAGLVMWFVLRLVSIIVTKHPAALGLDLICLTVIVVYMIAPSAEQFAKIVQTVSALKSGISFNTTSSVNATAGTAVSTTQATPVPDDGELPESERIK